MLFGYPLDATAENWLHDCVCQMLREIQQSHSNGSDPPAWPELIPASHRPVLETRRGLRDRILAYKEADASLTPQERDAVADAMIAQNDIPGLLACATHCSTLQDLPEVVRDPLVSLFEFAFDLLTDLGIRDRQYALIFSRLKYRVCPFCGCENLSAPQGPREALDHYLAESRYPLAAANLRNLAPIGHSCNSKYKLAQDMLRREDGTRRRSFDPYNAPGLSVSLENSVINSGLGPLISEWRVDFSIAMEEVETWDRVFSIRARYVRDVLDPSLNAWLWEFHAWCTSVGCVDLSDEGVITALMRYVGYLDDCGLNDRFFLRTCVFRLLLCSCERGERRTLDIMRDLMLYAV